MKIESNVNGTRKWEGHGSITEEPNRGPLRCRSCACKDVSEMLSNHKNEKGWEGGEFDLLVTKTERTSRRKTEMCSRLRSEVWPAQCICIHGCSMSWETVARSDGSFLRQQATNSHICGLAAQPGGNVGGSSLTILFMMSQYLQQERLKPRDVVR
jgi:hypothetical protein